MIVIKTKAELRKKLNELKNRGIVGFIPTMGAIHRGHLSLVQKAASENAVVVVSIFVNPTQFNNPADLERYPRNLDTDLQLLESTGCDLVFVPDVDDIYPVTDTRKFNFGMLDKVMEGKHRPGHFNGVAQVVSILLNIVKPDKAYFGMKDFQQLVIIKRLVTMLNHPVRIVSCPIIREKSGLAMSSRNELLSHRERENAALIFNTLSKANNQTEQKSVQELRKWVIETINKNAFLKVEYFEIVNSESLEPIKSWQDKGRKVACIAVYCGKVRLIDNYFFN